MHTTERGRGEENDRKNTEEDANSLQMTLSWLGYHKIAYKKVTAVFSGNYLDY